MNLLPSLGEKDIFRTFQLMPGISAANENSSGLYVRGGTPDQSLVLYDGITIYNVEHLFGFFSAFNSNAIKDIQLYKGGFDAKHGGRLSSVVEITGRDGSPNKFGAMADISLMSANLYMELPLGNKITFLAAGRRSWQSPFYNAIYNKTTGNKTSQVGDKPDGMGMPDGDNKTNFKAYFYDLNAKLTYKPTSRDIISVSFYNGKDDLDNSFQPEFAYGSKYISIDNVDKTEWGNTGVAGKWSHNCSRKLYSNLLISY